MRLFSRYHLTALCVACTLVQVLLCSCRQESVLPSPSPSHGLVVLSLSADDVAFVETRGEQTLSDLSALSFTLSGQTADGRTVENLPLTFMTTEDNAFVATVETGTYTLSAATPDEDAESGFGTPSYAGESDVEVTEGETATVEIHLKPRNARVSVQIDESFSKLYECTKVELSALSPATKDTRTVTIENPSTESPPAYFLLSSTDSQLTYTLYGNAHKASHQQELPESGVTGTLTLEAGHAYTLNIKANPVTGKLIPVIGKTHDGEFD